MDSSEAEGGPKSPNVQSLMCFAIKIVRHHVIESQWHEVAFDIATIPTTQFKQCEQLSKNGSPRGHSSSSSRFSTLGKNRFLELSDCLETLDSRFLGSHQLGPVGPENSCGFPEVVMMQSMGRWELDYFALFG